MLARFLARVAEEARAERYARECAAVALREAIEARERADAYARECASWAYANAGALLAAGGHEIGPPGAAQAQGTIAWNYAAGPTAAEIARWGAPLSEALEPEPAVERDPGSSRGYRPAWAAPLGRRP